MEMFKLGEDNPEDRVLLSFIFALMTLLASLKNNERHVFHQEASRYYQGLQS